MNKSCRVYRDDCEDLGFATECLVGGVISFDEFKNWLYELIKIMDDFPVYLYDILDVDSEFDYTLRSYELIGFTPYWKKSSKEELALDGIGYKRQLDFSSDLSSKDSALQALLENPHIEERFRLTFPFIPLHKD